MTKKIEPLKNVSSERLLEMFFDNGGTMDRRNFCIPVDSTRETRRVAKVLVFLMIREDGKKLLAQTHKRFLRGKVDSCNFPIVKMKRRFMEMIKGRKTKEE